jgi:hypothetical protein
MKKLAAKKAAKKGDFFDFFFFYVRYSTLLICRPSDFSVSEDAGIEPRTVAI